MSFPDERCGLSDTDTKLCSDEAKAAVKEVAFGVRDIQLASSELTFSDSLAFINLTTLEGERMCIEISLKGFCPVGKKYDEIAPYDHQSDALSNPDHSADPDVTYYETIYSLLSALSPKFRDCFSERLSTKLQALSQLNSTFNDEEINSTDVQNK